ncbi:MAG TPA: protein adenylyltransferase SelO family protein, partial [Salinimicrobium sp.]|nr:protein adenylyltransferase SelO family protein [Salinimicrobium sp.]
MKMKQLGQKIIKGEFTLKFKGDDSGNMHSRLTPDCFYAKAMPTPVKTPELIAWNKPLAKELGLESPNQEGLSILSGNKILPAMYPYASCYGGHQFGHWAGQLGDGRAINLGEINSKSGNFELQLKGAGPTPYSRGADGRAV